MSELNNARMIAVLEFAKNEADRSLRTGSLSDHYDVADLRDIRDWASEASYDLRGRYSCKVCSNVPDADGTLEHGKGCYTQSQDGGGESFVEFD